MARAYSLDLRERVVAAVVGGQSRRSAARAFGVSVASVVKWLTLSDYWQRGCQGNGRQAALMPLKVNATGCWRASAKSPT